MNVSALQFYVFLACVSLGFICGVFFLVFLPFKQAFSNKWVNFSFDLISFLLSSVFYVFVSYKLNFPNLRVYMLFGVMIGLFIYFETLHIPLAKLLKTVYNIISKKLKDKKRIKKIPFKE